MGKLNDAQNAAFMNDPRRLEAEKELKEAVEGIRGCLTFFGSADYYLKVLPQRLKRLEEANERLNVVEATVEAEIAGKIQPEDQERRAE
jgi:hypothetical protein